MKISIQIVKNIDKSFIHSLEKAEHGKCVVPNCDKQKSFKFFKFPKQQEKFDNWLTLCGLNTVKKEDRICADHFMKSDFCLRPSACPSLNLWSNDTQQYLMTERIQKKGNFYFFNLLTCILEDYDRGNWIDTGSAICFWPPINK